MAVLAIDRYLGQVRNRVVRCGVELEGAWSKRPSGVQIVGDGSVFRGRRTDTMHYGELPLGPFMPIALPKMISKYYPSKVDATCGLHVHMSFVRLRYYGVLITPDYMDTIVGYLGRWGKEERLPKDHALWPRLRNENEYCRLEFHPELQIATREKDFDHVRKGHRYTAIHYCWRLKTIECRLLPMMEDAQLAVRAVRRVIDITNACIYVLGKEKEQTISDGLELQEAAYEEDITESL